MNQQRINEDAYDKDIATELKVSSRTVNRAIKRGMALNDCGNDEAGSILRERQAAD
jgi:FixJ family two-component response regulator